MKTKTLVMACLLTAGAGSVAWAHPGRHGGGPREWLQQADSNKDGKITLAEVNAVANPLFDQADTNRDGRVTQPEQTAFREQLRTKMQAGHKEGFAERLADRDANKDGRLGADEVGRMPAGRFASLDANKDGYLAKDELVNAAKHGGERGQAHSAKLLERVDENHDGAIDRSEMQKEVQRRFSRLDRNSDGVVASDELRGGRGKHGGERGCDHDNKGKHGSRAAEAGGRGGSR
jgi:Ca2+-binding EF-hand superfamily protein